MAARYLHLSTKAWDALEWWERRLYMEGYEDEGLVGYEDSAPDPTVTREESHSNGGTTITERDHHVTLSGEPGEFTAFGIPERQLGA